MCGIAGYVTRDNCPTPDQSVLRQMLGMIRHRGPDEFGIYLSDNAGLGSARLSIIDLAGGQQPICNEDGSLWIVFNGEVFNYRELRKDLEERGHRFKTDTDTEVILHLYEDFGPGCLERMNGQFAVAIWNEREKSLFLGRDRLGVRPLFYTQMGGTLLFASEVKALLACPEIQARLDRVALNQVFTFWSAQAPRTCFEGIQEIPPGHFALSRDGDLKVMPWWRLEFRTGPERDLEDYTQELRSLLREATRLRLQADVPVGAYLSGGLDSSTVTAIARELGVSHLDTFSISFSDPRYDESLFQRQMAQFLGTEHQVAYATHEEIGDVFPEVVWHVETPILRTAPAPMFMLSKLVRSAGYKVVLTGEGADEFLAGYDIFKEAKIRRFWAAQPNSKLRPLLLKKLYPDIKGLQDSNTAFLAAFFGRGLGDTQSADYSHAIRWQNGHRLKRMLSEEMSLGADSETVEYPQPCSDWDTLQKGQFLEISTFLSSYLLSSQGDRVAMAHSVEGRYPFLDKRVVEFCTTLPARLKLRGLKDKFLLRKMAEDYIPPAIARRPKRPYRAPIQRCFFNGRPATWTQEVLDPSFTRSAGLFKVGAVEQLVRKAKAATILGETDEMALVGVISAHLFHQNFISNFRLARPVGGRDNVKVVDRRASMEVVAKP